MAANPQQIPIIYKGTALPASPTAANDGIYYIRPNSSVGFITYIITNGVVVQQDAVTSAGITALLANYITGNSNQTGLSGDKTTSGVWTYNGTGSTKINLLRPGSTSNVNMSFGFDTPEMYVGMPSTGIFAISLMAAMTVANRIVWIDNTGRVTSKNGFVINGQNDTQVLLAGGGYRPVSDFALSSALASYVLQTSLNAQLANYATLAGTQTFSGTNTFNQAPVVPAGTLNSHTVNLGQVNGLLNNKVDKVAGKGLSTEDYTTTEKTKLGGIEAGAEVNVNADWNATTGDAQILNKPIIPTVNDPVITVQGVGSIIGGGGFSLNQASGATYSLDLQSSVKTDIQNGAAAGALIGQFVNMFKFHNKAGGGSVDPTGVFFTLVGTGGAPGFTIDIQNHNTHGARLVLQRNSGSGITRYNIDAIDYALTNIGFVNIETTSKEYEWDDSISKWREIF